MTCVVKIYTYRTLWHVICLLVLSIEIVDEQTSNIKTNILKTCQRVEF